MTTLHRMTGFILSSRDHREADRRYTAFTHEQGKVEFLARGGFKPLAKLTPHLEMPAEMELLIVRGRTFDTIASVERTKNFPNLSQTFSHLLLWRNAMHLVDLATKAHEPDPILYDALERWIELLEANPAFSRERSGFLLGSFAVKLLAMIGYRPELHRCLSCHAPVAPQSFLWHSLRGGVVCRSCTEQDQEQWFASRTLSDDVLKLVRLTLVEPFESHLHVHLRGEVLEEFHDTVESLLVSHLPVIPANSLRAACQPE